MSDLWSERLSEYLDGDLSESEVREISLHLRDCPPCAHEIEGLRRVRARLAELPLSEPSERVWRSIRGGLEGGRVAPARRWGWPLAWASAAVAVSAGVVVLWAPWRGQRLGSDPSVPHEALSGGRSIAAPVPGVESLPGAATHDGARAYGEAAVAWRAALSKERLGAEMGGLLGRNLGSYDRAIEETREAIERDPGDPLLRTHLARMLRSQVRFLKHADTTSAGPWHAMEKDG